MREAGGWCAPLAGGARGSRVVGEAGLRHAAITGDRPVMPAVALGLELRDDRVGLVALP
jgi:hypothetical protein